MAKVTIIIEDQEDGSVSVMSDPSEREMILQIKDLAEKKIVPVASTLYAMTALTAILKKSTETRSKALSKKRFPSMPFGKKKAPK